MLSCKLPHFSLFHWGVEAVEHFVSDRNLIQREVVPLLGLGVATEGCRRIVVAHSKLPRLGHRLTTEIMGLETPNGWVGREVGLLLVFEPRDEALRSEVP